MSQKERAGGGAKRALARRPSPRAPTFAGSDSSRSLPTTDAARRPHLLANGAA